MAEIPTVTTLRSTRDEIRASIRLYEKRLAQARAARHLKAELKRAEVTYEELAERLKEHGFNETKARIANKLARATVSAHFYLASLASVGREGLRFEEI